MSGIDGAALRRMWRFGVVGVVGFVIDGGLLQVLIVSELCGSLSARAVSFPAAVLTTWYLNRLMTFGTRDPALRTVLRYVLVSSGGSAINFILYSSLVLGSASMAARPLIPFAFASAVAMVFNYLGAHRFAFRCDADS